MAFFFKSGGVQVLWEILKIEVNTNNMRSVIAKTHHEKMDMFKDKSELLSVTHTWARMKIWILNCVELFWLKHFYFFFFFSFLITYKNAK